VWNIVRTSFTLVIVAVSLAFLPTAALSNTVTQSIVLSGVVSGSQPTSTFVAFNPALGTLLDFSVTLSGTLNYDGTAADHPDTIGLRDQSSTASLTMTIPGYGTGLPFSFNVTTSAAGLLAEYSGTGSRDFVFELVSATGGDVFNVNGSGSVTFDYTSAATPEPGTLLLLGTGLASVLGMRRKKQPR
jgi:hypothetical protein